MVTVPTGYTCFVIVNLFPLYKVLDLWDNTRPVAGCVTFTTQEAVTPVRVSLAVIKTGSPVLCAVTSPSESTDTTEGLSDSQIILLVAVAGVMVVFSSLESPTLKEILVAFSLIFSTDCSTVTSQVAGIPPSSVRTTMVAFPPAIAFTSPLSDTVATDGSVDSQVTFLLVASAGTNSCVSLNSSPTFKVFFVLSSLISFTGTFMYILQRAMTSLLTAFPVSFGVAEMVTLPEFLKVTKPVWDTVAIFSSEERHTNSLSTAGSVDGSTTAVN